jgi:hypothetical protein
MFFLYFLSSSACFLVVFNIFFAYFVHLCILLFSPGTFSVLGIPFSIVLTVGISYLLGNVFEIIKCIFVISDVLGSFVLALFWTVL